MKPEDRGSAEAKVEITHPILDAWELDSSVVSSPICTMAWASLPGSYRQCCLTVRFLQIVCTRPTPSITEDRY